MTALNRLRAAWLRVRDLRRDARGVAAVETAIILPVAAMLMSLIVYGGQAYTVQRRVTLGATTVANILAQGNNNGTATITSAELNQILQYPSLILYPYSGAQVQVVLSQLLVTVNNEVATGTVIGSWPNANATARPQNQQLPIDPSVAAAFNGAGPNYVILGEVYYPFQPTGIYFSVTQITLHNSIMMIPRTAAQITVQ